MVSARPGLDSPIHTVSDVEPELLVPALGDGRGIALDLMRTSFALPSFSLFILNGS
jgi:hypothetical protein